MYIRQHGTDSFDLTGKLGTVGPSRGVIAHSDILDLVVAPVAALQRGLVGRLLIAIAALAGTVRFGRLFKLSLLAMAGAGAAFILLHLSGWPIFGRLYGAGMALAVVLSMGAALTEFVRDKGEEAAAAQFGDASRPKHQAASLPT